MALENSVLTNTLISDLLKKHYGIYSVCIKKLALGSANCYRVFDGEKYYFLKEFQSSFSHDAVTQEAKLLEYLSQKNIPTTYFYKTIQDDFSICFENHIICLEKYVEGQAYDYNDFPSKLLPQLGSMLGKLHAALKDYSLPVDMSDAWLASFSCENMISQYNALIDLANKKVDDKNIEKIIADLEYKKQLAIRCEEYKKYFNGITYCATHGDYQGCQTIFDGDEITAVIDFSSACTLPVIWEIMRSYVQSSETCRNGTVVDLDALCDYVWAYMKYAQLTKQDLISMPYVYLFQLARSKYGYPQYLNSASPDKARLLEFAFWRTQMCREIEKKAQAISDALLRCI